MYFFSDEWFSVLLLPLLELRSELECGVGGRGNWFVVSSWIPMRARLVSYGRLRLKLEVEEWERLRWRFVVGLVIVCCLLVVVGIWRGC